MPETVGIAKELIDRAWNDPRSFTTVKCDNSRGETTYHVQEFTTEYHYSPALEEKRRSTITKTAQQEAARLAKAAKTYEKRTFACEPDAAREIEVLTNKLLKYVKYHNVSFEVVPETKKRRGRPPKDSTAVKPEYTYRLVWHIEENSSLVEQAVKKESAFVLAGNDLNLSGARMLTEYRTQSSVEKKFQQLKSPHFVNALYLDKPSRIEALTYFILMAMMILSVAERVVRREMADEEAKVIGPGGVVMKRPSLRAILGIFHYVPVSREIYRQQVSRELMEPLNDSQAKILRYLGIPPTVFTDGPSMAAAK